MLHKVFGALYVVVAFLCAVSKPNDAVASVIVGLLCVAALHVYCVLVIATGQSAAERGYRKNDFMIFAALATPVAAFLVLFVLGIAKPRGGSSRDRED